jgi:hypothetical protein
LKANPKRFNESLVLEEGCVPLCRKALPYGDLAGGIKGKNNQGQNGKIQESISEDHHGFQER